MVTILSTSKDVSLKIGFSKARSIQIAKWSILAHIFLPLLICGYIYTFCRPSGMGLQCILSYLLGESTLSNYSPLLSSTTFLSEWIIYSFPAALWTFAISLLGMVLHIDAKRRVHLVALIPLGLTLGLELLQFTSFTNGTFDTCDIFAGFLGYASALFYYQTHHHVFINQSTIHNRRLLFAVLFLCVYVGDVWV